MKPIYLAMTAFGPFADTQNVNFNELGDNPLFLINGPTGAGKTTLLDAMTFALFGDTTGDRSGQNMRCDHAPNVLETAVELIFSYGAHTYRIERQPTQTVKARRGDGETTRQASATLWRVEATPPTDAPQEWEKTELLANKSTEVSQKVEALLGLNVNQFRQVVVLPQGRFRDFLIAKSNEREAVLESLFQTQRFKLIEDAINQRALKVNQAYKAMKDELDQRLNDMSQPTIAAAKANLAEQQQPLKAAKAEHDAARQQLQQAQTAHTQAEELIKRYNTLVALKTTQQELAQQHDAMHQSKQKLAAYEQALNLSPHWQAFTHSKAELARREQAQQTAQANVQQATEAHSKAQAALKTVAQHPAEIDKLNLRIPELEQQARTVAQVHQFIAELKQHANIIGKAEQDKLAAETQLTQLKANQAQANDALKVLRKRIKNHVNTEAKRARLTQQQQQLDELNKLSQKVNQTEQAWQITQAPLEAARAATEQAQQTRDQLYLRWYQEQAAALAQKLKTGEPCLVCGSTEHPAPAYADAEHELVSQKQLDQAEEHLSTKRRAEQQAQNNHNLAEQAHHSAINLRDEFAAAFAETMAAFIAAPDAKKVSASTLPDPEQLQTQLKQQFDELTQQEQTQQSERDQADQLETQLNTLDKQLAAQEHTVNTSKEHLQRQLTAQTSTESKLSTIDSDGQLRQLTVVDIQSQQQQAVNQREQLRSAYDNVQAQAKQTERAQQHAQANLDSSNTELANAKQALNEAEANWQEKLKASAFSNAEAYIQALLAQDAASQLKQQVAEYDKRVTEVQSGIASETKAIGKQPKPDLAVLAEQQAAAATQEKDKLDAWQHLHNQFTQLKDSIEKYQKRAAQSAELEKNYAVLGRLAQTLTGNNSSRVSLNRFVLAILLDDVLHEASQRLAQMSQGRYQLVRRTEGGDKRAQGGLELMIDDSHTGKQREVNTLSGGESFMAALALALGLSDVVQSYAGGIKIDTLFIDEGFGSLDSEALDLAIDVLAHLRDNGRTIGIISHVSELKQRINKRIDVVSGIGGSTVRVH